MSMFSNDVLDGQAFSGSVYDAAYDVPNVPASVGQGRIPTLGQMARFRDGRTFRFCRAGGTVTIGDLVCAVPNEANIVAGEFGVDGSTAPAAGEGGGVGDTSIRLSDAITGQTVNEYAGGFLNITDATGEGQQRKIKSNQVSGGTGGHLCELYDGLTTALDNTSVGTMINHECDGVVVHTAADYGNTPTQYCVGSAVVAATSGQYFWVQTYGTALVQAGVATFIAGGKVQLAEDDNGSGQIPVTHEHKVQTLGIALEAAADTVWGPVFLNICP